MIIKKWFAILLIILLICNSYSLIVYAGTEEDPEVTDVPDDAPDRYTGNNVDHLDILSCWFEYYDNNTFLASMKLKDLTDLTHPIGTVYTFLRVCWQYENDEHSGRTYYATMTIDELYSIYYTVYYRDEGENPTGHQSVEGEYTPTVPGIFTIKVPFGYVNNPDQDTVFTTVNGETWQGYKAIITSDFYCDQVDVTEIGRDYQNNESFNQTYNQTENNQTENNETKNEDEGDNLIIAGIIIVACIAIVAVCYVYSKKRK